VGFEGGEGDGGGFLLEGGRHDDASECWARAHASGFGDAAADWVGGHFAADDAEVGDEFANLAAELDRQGDVAGGEGGAPGTEARLDGMMR
jgi:hypothetical protein